MTLKWQSPVKALEMWQPEIKAAVDAPNSINIYDEIGEGFFSGGFTAQMTSEFLSNNKAYDVVLNINSAGGDMFEGLAIYNILKQHDAKVTVRVVGLAASAASIIAMAADELEIAASGFLMIHNAWSFVAGNKTELRKIADDFEKFDAAMAGIYAERSGQEYKDIVKMMDDETFLSAETSIELGLADKILGEEEITEDEKDKVNSLKRIDVALAKSGVTRSERRKWIKDITDTPCAVSATPCAGTETLDKALADLKSILVTTH